MFLNASTFPYLTPWPHFHCSHCLIALTIFWVSFVLTLFYQEIDGNALLLLKSDMIMKYLGLKLGPALKLCYHIDKLKQAKFWKFLEDRSKIQTADLKIISALPTSSHHGKTDSLLKTTGTKTGVFLQNALPFPKVNLAPFQRLFCVNDLPKKIYKNAYYL